MNFVVDISNVSLKILKQFAYSSEHLSDKNNIFTIILNDYEFILPLEIAICYSSSIFSLYETDPTIRKIKFDIQFHDNNMAQKIIEILTDQNDSNLQINLKTENEIFDLASFGKEFGFSPFIKPLYDYYSKELGNINKENVFKLYDYLQFFGSDSQVKNKIISFISENFHYFANEDSFIDWCCTIQNEEIVESIINNKKLKVKTENQLLQFIIKLCKKEPKYECLFSFVFLEYCDKDSCKSFIDYLTTNKNECQTHSMKLILECIGRRLCQEKLPVTKINNINRYIEQQLEEEPNFEIFANVSLGYINIDQTMLIKYIQKINDKSYKFLYPGEDNATCSSVFKVTLKPGNYKLECVGASGGKGEIEEGGYGGYSCGVLSLEEKANLYLYIGGVGSSVSGSPRIISKGGFNGGGDGMTGSGSFHAGGGGGATDIRLNSQDLDSRIIVAGGGGGTARLNKGKDSPGGNGGGINGQPSSKPGDCSFGTGGTQSNPGICCNGGSGTPGNKNQGGNGNSETLESSSGGGGGGYYGGGGGYWSGGGGGSGYLSSHILSMNGIQKETKEFNNIGNGYITISLL